MQVCNWSIKTMLRLHFYEFNSNGVELDHFTYQDGQYNMPRRALLRMNERTVYSNYVVRLFANSWFYTTDVASF